MNLKKKWITCTWFELGWQPRIVIEEKSKKEILLCDFFSSISGVLYYTHTGVVCGVSIRVKP